MTRTGEEEVDEMIMVVMAAAAVVVEVVQLLPLQPMLRGEGRYGSPAAGGCGGAVADCEGEDGCRGGIVSTAQELVVQDWWMNDNNRSGRSMVSDGGGGGRGSGGRQECSESGAGQHSSHHLCSHGWLGDAAAVRGREVKEKEGAIERAKRQRDGGKIWEHGV